MLGKTLASVLVLAAVPLSASGCAILPERLQARPAAQQPQPQPRATAQPQQVQQQRAQPRQVTRPPRIEQEGSGGNGGFGGGGADASGDW